MSTEQNVPVIQADRDFTADFLAEAVEDAIIPFTAMRAGECDDDPYVQAFARYRLRLQQPIGGTAREVLIATAQQYHPGVATWLLTDPILTNTPYEIALRAIQSVLDREAGLRSAARNILPYLRFTVGSESPGHHPTMPSAVAAFEAALTPVPIEAGEVCPPVPKGAQELGEFLDEFERSLGQPTPSASSEVDRKAVAMIIDPVACFSRDCSWQSVNQKAALAKADAILALLPPTGNSRGEG